MSTATVGASLEAPGEPVTVVTLMYLDHCPNWPLAADRLRAAIARVGTAGVRIDWKPVHTVTAAAAAGFAGSPTLLIDGKDPFPRPSHVNGLCCRFYETENGPSGAPSIGQLVHALQQAQAAS